MGSIFNEFVPMEQDEYGVDICMWSSFAKKLEL